MFQRLDAGATPGVRLDFEGRTVTAEPGDTVAAALLAAGIDRFRDTPVGGRPRAPYCMMGICFDCLVEIDGVPNRQACMVPVADGMKIRRQQGAREVA
jgi:predicted molibdopterin-dependent oxidoreductase YjgC